MIIKVCGLREPENIRAVVSLNVDMIGFIFWPQSSRYVQMISSRAGIIPDYSQDRLHKLENANAEAVPLRTPSRVGVFVDDMPQNIVTRVYNYSLDYVQLHGEESPVMIDNLRRTIDPDIHPNLKIIKTLSINTKEDVLSWHAYEGCVDMFLFDTKCDSLGGSGKKFNWSLLEAYDGNIPFLLSGGIGRDDVDDIKSFSHPQFAGIDLNSCFETSPAVKDIDKLKSFIQAVRQ
ncbi:MAG: phosphoribosylanthranilate isomerase [Prevotella sp.]|nr:phosphoribosylanthranilate isomerase [Prevotella sp.]